MALFGRELSGENHMLWFLNKVFEIGQAVLVKEIESEEEEEVRMEKFFDGIIKEVFIFKKKTACRRQPLRSCVSV